jgi:iron complex outermembrane receptor protein
LGVSYVRLNGYTGISIDQIKHDYGVPTVEGSQITQVQNRLNFEHLIQNPWAGISALKTNFYTGNYSHHELDGVSVPQTYWTSSGFGGKLELEHENCHFMTGKLGLQISSSQLQAIDSTSGNAAIVPLTKSDSRGVYWIEESKLNTLKLLWGLRYDIQNQNPDKNATYAGGNSQFSSGSYSPSSIINRQFGLWAYSIVADWKLGSAYGSSLGYTRSQRAPSAVELYGYGPHDSTATFIVGNSNLSPEVSNDIEWKLYKSFGALQAKSNLYWMHFDNYIYGMNTSNFSLTNNYFSVVTTNQAAATIFGLESEISYLFSQQNIMVRAFGDINRGTFDAGGNLPLQPAPRIGLEIKHEADQITTQISYLHSFTQNHLATFEIGPTPAYDLVNFNVSYKQRVQDMSWMSYIKVTNLLNQDIRYSTTPETVRLYAPQMARSLLIGFRVSY